MAELTYENVAGDTVYTSTYLKNRGTCCKTSCLHCPYGYTLNDVGLQFTEVTEDRLNEAQSIIDGEQTQGMSSISASLLAGAFGAPKKATPITLENKKYYKFILIKGQVCGLLRSNVTQPKEIFLLEHFKNQDLSLEMVSSFL